MATLSEIAEKCGVSTATVSYVLSGKGEEKRISPAMQELVRTTAEQLGYKQRTAGASAPAQTRVAVFWPPEEHRDHPALRDKRREHRRLP
ncbi:MAG: LacI family DNA-binding transcriptional regulator [Oscillospiraceae bacterium]